MKQISLAFVLLLAYASFSTTSPIADNSGETVADEEHSADRRDAQTETQEEQTDTVSGSEVMETGSESLSSEYSENESESESSESSEKSESESSVDESEVIADRKRRSDDTENQLLGRILLWRKDLRFKLGEMNGVQRDSSSTDGGQSSAITIEQLFDLLNMSPEGLTKVEIDMNEDVMSMDVDELKIEAQVDTDVGVDSDQAVDNLLDSLSSRKLGGISGRSSRINRPLEYRDTAASGGRTAKRETAGVDGIVPETGMPTKVNTDDVDVNQLLDDLGLGKVRIHVRQTVDPDSMTEQMGGDDTDSGDTTLVDANVLTEDTSLLKSIKKQIIDDII